MVIKKNDTIPFGALGAMHGDCKSPVQLQEQLSSAAVASLTGWIVSVGIFKQAFVDFGLEPAPVCLDRGQEAQFVDIFQDLLNTDLLAVIDAMPSVVAFANQLLFDLAGREAVQTVVIA